ncbi:MAG: hypothetical protein AMXMBFR82_10070 [Candidatus Hydrogenedentota bacterium]
MSLNRRISTGLLAAVLACCGLFVAGAQEANKELVDAQDPFILNPPSTSLEPVGEVDLPPANTALDERPRAAQVTTPNEPDGDTADGSAVRTERPERPTPKNVTRIDNDPKRKRSVQPTAVIKAQLAPWGYTRRYLEGDIAEPEHPFGSGQQPGIGGLNRPNQDRGQISLRGNRGRRDRDED